MDEIISKSDSTWSPRATLPPCVSTTDGDLRDLGGNWESFHGEL